ncbi:MAG: hypothetical protein V1755_09090, partial [Chloroflexota bacterium]
MLQSKRSGSARRYLRLFLVIPMLLVLLGCTRATSGPPAAPAEQAGAPPAAVQEAGAPPAAAALAPGDTTRTLSHAGIEREYILHVPSRYDAAR